MLRSMNNLAEVLSSQYKQKEAEEMHRHVLALRETVLGKEHPDTLGSMNNLAEVLSRQGKQKGVLLVNHNIDDNGPLLGGYLNLRL